jgi:hypothetical protein
MPNETKIVKGGFRATLALIISVIAVILSVIAFNRTGGGPDLKTQLKDLQEKVGNLKQDTDKRVDKIRQDTANALQKLSEELKTKEK